MILRSAIFSSLVLAAVALGADVSGAVRLSDSRDPAVRHHNDFSGVVVWLEPVSDLRPVALKPVQARMEQKGKRFVPHVVAITAGSAVTFPNRDPIFHSAFSNFSGQIFDLGLYAPGTSRTITFTRAGVVRVFCNIHPTMSAVIVVLKTPWFVVSDSAGAFDFRDVPAGQYVLHVFHERATAATLGALQRRVQVESAPVRIPPLTISETGYLETPHKNKYGHDYPPGSGEGGTYPGGTP